MAIAVAVSENIYSISRSHRIRGICNTCI